MACYRPIRALRNRSGGISFHDQPGDLESLQLPCGRCVGCRTERAQAWSVRCQHEASLYFRNSFLTLTYSDDRVPVDFGLHYRHCQLFMKRLRRRYRGFDYSPDGRRPIRFFVAGEYGDVNRRPHFHYLLFNFDFLDKYQWSESTWRSESLEELWAHGSSVIGSVTPASCGYVSQYAMKKLYGGTRYYTDVDVDTGEVFERRKEFVQMSRDPGIGSWWYDRWRSDVLPRDYVVAGQQKFKVPKYYARKFAASEPLEWEEVQYARYLESRDIPAPERTDDRRRVAEQVHTARLDFYRHRSL